MDKDLGGKSLLLDHSSLPVLFFKNEQKSIEEEERRDLDLNKSLGRMEMDEVDWTQLKTDEREKQKLMNALKLDFFLSAIPSYISQKYVSSSENQRH